MTQEDYDLYSKRLEEKKLNESKRVSISIVEYDKLRLQEKSLENLRNIFKKLKLEFLTDEILEDCNPIRSEYYNPFDNSTHIIIDLRVK